MARAAGRMAGRFLPKAKRAAGHAANNLGPVTEQGKLFVKHVVPATIKPIHSLWHEVLGFIFLAFAGIGGFRLWQRGATMAPVQMVIVGLFVCVMAGYGISSILKARRISRS
jgi:hypothetical protein